MPPAIFHVYMHVGLTYCRLNKCDTRKNSCVLATLIMTLLFYSSQQDTELRAHPSTHNTDTAGADSSYFNQMTGNVSYSIVDTIIDPVLDDMADPAPALPPRSQPKKTSKKPGVVQQVIDTMRYAYNAQQNLGEPPTANSPPVKTHACFQGQVQQAAQYPPQVIYEDSD